MEGGLNFSSEDAADKFSVIIIRIYTPFGMIVTIHLSLISIISPPVAVLFCMTIHCHFVVCHCCQIQLITSIVRLVVAGNRC